jgi:hypothetical protein
MNSVPGSFWEWVALLDSGERTGLMVMCIIGFVFIITFALATIYKIHKNRLEDSLKRELLDRGLSTDEIATVIRARPIRSHRLATNSNLGDVSR